MVLPTNLYNHTQPLLAAPSATAADSLEVEQCPDS